MTAHPAVSAVAAALLSLVATGLPSGAGAEEWTFPGARYQAMGGAGVAVVNDGHAAYWNPGALAFHQATAVELPFSLSTAALGDGLANADDIADLIAGKGFGTVLTKVQSGTPLTLAELRDALSVVAKLPGLGESGDGFLALPAAGFTLRRGRLAVTVRGSGSLGVDPVLDLANLAFSDDVDALTQVTNVVAGGADRTGQFTNAASQPLADAIAAALAAWSQDQAEELVFQAEQAGLDTAAGGSLITSIAEDTGALTAQDLALNGSGARLRGLFTQEVGVAYAHPLFGNRLGIGGQVRYLRGVTTTQFIQYDDVVDGQDLISELTDFQSQETSQNVSADLGILYRPNYRWRFGIVGRNLTSPSFDVRGADDYEVDPQVRVGVALNVLRSWVVAVDVDVTENDSDAIDGYASRLLSVGSELVLGGSEAALALRAGAFTNLAQDAGDSVTLTAGIGFRVWRLELDLAVAASPEFQELEAGDLSIPSRLQVSGALRYLMSF